MLRTSYLTWTKDLDAEIHRAGAPAANFSSSAMLPDEAASRALFAPKRGKPFLEDPVFRAPVQWGHADLAQTISAAYRIPTSQILTTSGASLAMFLVCRALLQPNEEALVGWPTYEPFLTAVEAVGARPISLWRNPRSYRLDAGLLRVLLRRSAARAVILSNPHNPSGVFLSDGEICDLAEAAAEFDAPLIVDEIFRDLIPGAGASFPIHENIVAINGLSKVYGISSFRCAWITASPQRMERIRNAWVAIENIGSQLTEGLATLVLRHRSKLQRGAQKRLRENSTEAARQLETLATEGLLDLPPASSIGLYFPQLTRVKDTDAFAAALRRKKVYVVPGSFFGAPDHVRLGVGRFEDAAAVREGFRRFAAVLRQFQSE